MAGDAPELETPYMLHLVLRDGFRGHVVVVTMNDRVVYQAVGVTTNFTTARADMVDIPSAVPTARLEVVVTPGTLASAMDVDLVSNPHVAISLVGTGTVAFETSPAPFS